MLSRDLETRFDWIVLEANSAARSAGGNAGFCFLHSLFNLAHGGVLIKVAVVLAFIEFNLGKNQKWENQSSDVLQHSQNRPTEDRWLKL